jgi:hypothetical protein
VLMVMVSFGSTFSACGRRMERRPRGVRKFA